MSVSPLLAASIVTIQAAASRAPEMLRTWRIVTVWLSPDGTRFQRVHYRAAMSRREARALEHAHNRANLASDASFAADYSRYYIARDRMLPRGCSDDLTACGLYVLNWELPQAG